MIRRIRGTVWERGEESIIVNVGGVGLQVDVPSTVLAQLDGSGRSVELFTHFHVRENDLSLYGFLTKEELRVFEQLLGVSGVGPKVAMSLLSTVSPDVLRQAVAQDQPSLLTRVPGIGKKTAAAIVFNLKDKLELPELAGAPPSGDVDADVIEALTGLGFSLVEAQAAVQQLPQDEDLSMEEKVRRALAYFA